MTKTTIALLTLALTGCGTLGHKLDEGMALACTPSGQTTRDGYRAVRTPAFLEQDKALCLRCPGEAALQCTGDPKALPQ